MAAVLEVRDLVKTYPSFRLQSLSFTLEEGKITGFIGRNGAGKTTTLHSLLSFLAPDSGEIRFWGQDMRTDALAIKQRVGFVSAGMNYYNKKKLRTITAVTRSFYTRWDEAVYGLFHLVFFPLHYKDVSRTGVPFLIASVVVFLFITLDVVLSYALPFWRDVLDTPDPEHRGEKLLFTAVCAVFYLAATLLALRLSQRRFEKLDIR